MSFELADIGLIGLAVMGQNLVLNMDDHGFKVCVFNRTLSKVDEFLAREAKGTKVIGSHSMKEFCEKLKKPRRVLILVKAGLPVDDMIQNMLPYLESGDIIIDGGNSQYTDTIRRESELSSQGILFVGSGVSGGEEGARRGPSLMPGGSKGAWPHIKNIFQSISAKVNGEPCCDWVGQGGSGHFVKMVHNGIEYGDMQLICESYHLLKEVCKLTNDQLAQVFEEWNKGELDSFLIELTSEILHFKGKPPSKPISSSSSEYLVDHIYDAAGQKGTGKWTVMASLETGTPLTLIGEAVYARFLSSLKEERVHVSNLLPKPSSQASLSDQKKKELIEDIRKALYLSKIISYAQGFMLMKKMSETHKWDLNFGGIALMWRGGCIIRSQFLGNIKEAFDRNPHLSNLLLDPHFTQTIEQCQESLRKVVNVSCCHGVSCPSLFSALSFYDGYRSEWLPHNLLQAMRDYFGAHTYRTLEDPFTDQHTDWSGTGGRITSTAYNN